MPKNSYLIVDSGHTPGYRKTTDKKSSGSKSHFFSRFEMNFLDEIDRSSKFEAKLQKVTNDTYLKIYDIDGALANKILTFLKTLWAMITKLKIYFLEQLLVLLIT